MIYCQFGSIIFAKSCSPLIHNVIAPSFNPCTTSDFRLQTSTFRRQTSALRLVFASLLVHILLTLKLDQHFCIAIIHLLKLSLEFCELVHHSNLTFRSTHIDGCEFIDTLMKSLFTSTGFFVLFVKFLSLLSSFSCSFLFSAWEASSILMTGALSIFQQIIFYLKQSCPRVTIPMSHYLILYKNFFNHVGETVMIAIAKANRLALTSYFIALFISIRDLIICLARFQPFLRS